MVSTFSTFGLLVFRGHGGDGGGGRSYQRSTFSTFDIFFFSCYGLVVGGGGCGFVGSIWVGFFFFFFFFFPAVDW